MVKSGIILPKLVDKQLISKATADARFKNNVEDEKLEKTGRELQSLCLPIPKTNGIMDIERSRTLGPLAEWQIHRAQVFPYVPLRQQEALVTEWLHRNHFRVTSKLPRLDPIVLTTRGADFGKFINFIYPAPFSLRFRSDAARKRRRKNSNGEELTKLREACPRLERTKRNTTDVFTLNPVIRVGGGYKRVTWNSWEVLPAIGQSNEDVTSEFSCVRCGVNLAVPHEIIDDKGRSKLVITYPSNCANCGKEVNSLRIRTQDGLQRQHITQEDLETIETGKYRDNSHEISNTAGGQLRMRSEEDQSAYSDDTGFSFTPVGRDNSFFITEADGSIKQIKNVNDPSSNNGKSLDEMQIIEHRDPESGIKVRVRRKGENKGKVDDEKYYIPGKEDTVVGKSGMEPSKRERSRKGSVIAQGGIMSDEFEDNEGYPSFLSRQNQEKLSLHKKKSSSKIFRYRVRRNALSDSELLIPERYFNLLRRKRISSKKRKRLSSRYRSYVNGYKESTGSEAEFSRESWTERNGAALVGNNRVSHSSSLAEMRNRPMHQEPDNPDGYMADSEEDKDSLLKLQAQLLQLKLDARKKSSGKDKKSKSRTENSKSRNRGGHTHVKEKNGQLTKKSSSFSIFGLESDSWDSDESLHFDPLSDGYSSSDNEISPRLSRPRAASLDDSELPSHRNSLISFYNELERDTQGEQEIEDGKSDSVVNDKEEDDTAVQGSDGKRRRYRHSFKRRPTNKTRKAVPTLPIVPHRSKLSSKWDEDDLCDSDINQLTAQMQMAFQPKETGTDCNEEDVRYCKGQYCHRCGSYVDGCEATCIVCGTHCKRPDPPCTACREICERCGKAKARCESRDEELGTSEDDLKAKGIGLADEKNNDYQNKGSQDEGSDLNDGDDERKVDSAEDGDRTSTIVAENSFFTEGTNSQRSSKRGRKMIIKKHKKSGSRYTKRGKLQRTLTMETMDSMETIVDQQKLDSEEDEANIEETNQDAQDIQEENFQVARPQPSKYNKSNKKSKPSQRIISQTVIYKTRSSLSQASSMDQTNEDDRDEKDEIEEDEIDEDDQKGAIQAPTEPPPQDDQKEEKLPEKVETKKTEQLELKNQEAEKPKQENKEKPQIPKPKLRGVQRVNAAYRERVELNRRLQSMLKDALQNVIAEADIKVRRDSTIDYLVQYRLVDRSKIEVYGRAFALEDEEERGIINFEQMLLALEGIPTIQGMSRQQLNYVLQVLEIDTFSRVSFKMFAVITALCERVTTLDPFVKELVEGLDLTETEWKLDMYKDMFYVAGNRSLSFISPDDLRIELKAGGLNQNQEDHVIKHITQSCERGQISFLDYMAYLPLFLSIHQNICSNALDMSRDKYTSRKTKTTT